MRLFRATGVLLAFGIVLNVAAAIATGNPWLVTSTVVACTICKGLKEATNE